MHKNNGTLVRLVASAFVLIQHAWMLAGKPDPAGSTGYLPWIGQIGVLMFFALSGYLLTKRILVEDIIKFIISRIFRIYPLLLFVNAIIMILGLIITDRKTVSYFQEGAIKLIFGNIIFFGQQYLPGVRIGGEYIGDLGRSMNLAQWSLFYEIRAYVILVILFIAGIIADRRVFNGLLIVVITLQAGQTWLHFGDPRAFDVTLAFLFGVGICVNNIKLDIRLAISALCFASVATFLNLSYAGITQNLTVAILTLYIAFGSAPYMRAADTKVDLSYGMFLLHWPIMLTLTGWLPPNPWLLLTVGAGGTILIAYPLNRFVEEPSRLLGRKLGRCLSAAASIERATTVIESSPSPRAEPPVAVELAKSSTVTSHQLR